MEGRSSQSYDTSDTTGPRTQLSLSRLRNRLCLAGRRDLRIPGVSQGVRYPPHRPHLPDTLSVLLYPQRRAMRRIYVCPCDEYFPITCITVAGVLLRRNLDEVLKDTVASLRVRHFGVPLDAVDGTRLVPHRLDAAYIASRRTHKPLGNAFHLVGV